MKTNPLRRLLDILSGRKENEARFVFGSEPDAFKLQKKWITHQNPIIFDVGAHRGETLQRYLEVFEDPLVHCFEPFPPAYSELNLMIEKQKQVVAHRVALSNQVGKASLHCNANSQTNSLKTNDPSGEEHWGKELLAPTEKTLVDVDTIDNFCEANSINAIDILKLDIQGNELEALLGASKMLSRGDIHLVYSEAIFVPTYSAQSSPNELMNFLYSKNYILVDILNSARSNGRLYQADLLFVSSKLLP